MMRKFLLKLTLALNRILPNRIKSGLYRLGPISNLIRRGLNQISPVGQGIVQISGGILQGMTLELDLQSEKDYWLGTYEMDLQAIILDQVKTGWTVYDVGANIGYISLALARMVGKTGMVHAFEALPSNLKRLERNIELNHLDDRIRVNSAAVSGVSGPVTFLIGPSGAMGKVSGSAGRQEVDLGSIQVSGIALDDYIYRDGNPAPKVVKMDIEGGEVLALGGMVRLLEQDRPLVFLELHGTEAAETAWGAFTTKGYRICKMKPGLPEVKCLSNLDWKSYLVAVP